jgi:hypothetical protein
MSPNSSQFTASLDTASKAITGFIGCLMAVVIVLAGVVSHNIYLAGIAVLLFALSYAWAPRGYAIEDRSIMVNRLIGAVRIPLDDVRAIRPASPDDLSGAIRVWGNGGVFGYYGRFRTPKLGKCSWYITNRRNAVVVITGEKTVVLSPDNVDGFLARLRGVARPSGRAPEPVAPVSSPRGVRTWIGFAVGAISLGVVALAFLYSPGAPAYTLTPSALTIHDRFYPVTVPAGDVDLSGVRVVDLASEPSWRTTARTNGFANSHYESGWFRVANGAKVEMYRAGGNRLVLLPPKNAQIPPILLQTADPETFIARLKQEWGGK